MKNFLVAIIFIGVAAYIGLTLYNSWVEGDWAENGTEIPAEEIEAPSEIINQYPANLEVESVDGRKISITLTGRTATHIQFKRIADGEAFVYPIENLVSNSKQLIEQYPANGLDPTDVVASGENDDTNVGDVYVKELQVAIDRIDQKLKQLTIDFHATNSKTKRRTIENKADELKFERNALIGKIRNRE
ncbi:MAG: hypothetical protein ACSHYA_17595 [Opitutaceae bacterium]